MSVPEEQVGVQQLDPKLDVKPAAAGRRLHPLLDFVLRRLAIGLVTLVAASAVIFWATNALPGDVAQATLGRNANPKALASMRHELHLEEPLLTRYVDWLGGAVHGELGNPASTITQGVGPSVAELIGPALRNTLWLALITFALLVPLTVLLATISALRVGRPADYAISYSSLLLGSLPEFVLGTILILIFFTQLNLLPPLVLPTGNPLDDPEQLVLPVLTLLGVSLSFAVRQLRVGVIHALNQEYVTMARLGGIREYRVLWRYALRNSLAPAIQSFAQTALYLFGGTVIVEALYSYPGIGRELVQAVGSRDISTVQGITLVLTSAYILINIVADLAVVLVVPRLRTGGESR
ncbi:MAG: ABC transporter permease [Actinobacteria bacterium]|nr:ABC transporter permease [Actinomycetota bacterium]